MTGTDILRITKPTKLFSGTSESIKTRYHELCKLYHPDTNPGDNTLIPIFQHINKLYDEAMGILKSSGGTLLEDGVTFLKDLTEGKDVKVRYLTKYDFELGEVFVSENFVTFLFKKEYETFWSNASQKIGSLKYPNSDMEKEFKRYMPEIFRKFKTTEDRYVLIIRKTTDVLPLKDVLKHFGKLEDKHVAWIMSRLHNLICFLNYNQISHNGLVVNNCFVSPSFHSIVLLGGWWYSTKIGDKLVGCPVEVFDILPPDVRKSKISNGKIDCESIRLIGRSLLGDPIGSKLLMNKAAPEPLINWLRLSSEGKPIEEFKKWDEVLTKSFGKRKFIKMELTAEQLYM